MEYSIHLKANFDPKLNANDVVLRIPTPLNTTSVNCKVQLGKAKYVPAENVIIWKYVADRPKRGGPSSDVMPCQNTAYARRAGDHPHGGSYSGKHDTSASVVETAHRVGLLR